MASILLILANNSQAQGNVKKAKKLYKKVISISEKDGYHQIKTEAKIGMGSLLLNLKKYKEARLIFSIALNDALQFELLGKQLKAYEKLKIMAVETSNYEEAFFFNSKYYQIKDSINKLQKTEKINELEIKYEIIKKEK
ncbi:Histidine kinase (fragment) [Tenacibaculum soleae]|uniref:hypothetical protein n=1 Tax=Tenacibaculum soleae TaxID=447689 RepID=UPI003AB207CC